MHCHAVFCNFFAFFSKVFCILFRFFFGRGRSKPKRRGGRFFRGGRGVKRNHFRRFCASKNAAVCFTQMVFRLSQRFFRKRFSFFSVAGRAVLRFFRFFFGFCRGFVLSLRVFFVFQCASLRFRAGFKTNLARFAFFRGREWRKAQWPLAG